ncbi:MAG: glycoside hydrolase family 2 protein [Hominenteromicrobium sp.]
MDWKLAYAPHEACAGQEFRTIEALESAGFACIPASVPGNFELDLMKSGREKDLYFSDQTWEAQKYEATHVWYYTTFSVENERQYLRFEGIDTFADIYVNGKLVQSANNMFLPWEVADGLRTGENEVVVHIRPAMLEARRFVPAAACNAQKYSYASLYARKAAHMYGWDIMPRIVSAGLWKNVTLCERKPDRISEVYFVTNAVDPEKRSASMRFFFSADLSGSLASEYSVRIEGHCGESGFVREERLWHNTHAFFFTIENCRFWWPKNAGRADLYDTTVTLLRGGTVCDTYRLNVGVRTLELELADDTDGADSGAFCFKINGKRIFVLGTNWVPLDAFHAQDSGRLERALALLDDVGCNMVRCWGGNVYESDAFFDFCDAHGILVWQDFAMGCAVYPEDEQFVRLLETEAVYQIKRLRGHAALALWAGDNEGDLAYMEWNGFRRNPNRNRLTREVLRHAVEMHDYATPYLPSSPYVSETAYQGKGVMPENHLWGPRDYFKGAFYRSTFCHFASETGYHGFPSVQSLKRFLREPERIFKADGVPTDEYLAHAASMEAAPDAPYAYRIRLAWNQVVTLFGKAEPEMADFVRQSQISQAEAKKYFIEKFRIGKWRRTGIIWWNLLDGWPQVSDAVVDYYFVKKLAYHYIRRSQEPVCLMFDEPESGSIRLVGVNDLPQDAAVTYRVTRVAEGDGADETVLSGHAVLAADTSAVIGSLPVADEEQEFYRIEWQKDGRCFQNHYFTNILNIDYKKYLNALRKCGMDEFEGMEDDRI